MQFSTNDNNRTSIGLYCLVYKGSRHGSAIPPFSSSVLKPGLDLSIRHLKFGGDGRSLGSSKVLLSSEAVLELRQLRPCERRAGFLACDQ